MREYVFPLGENYENLRKFTLKYSIYLTKEILEEVEHASIDNTMIFTIESLDAKDKSLKEIHKKISDLFKRDFLLEKPI